MPFLPWLCRADWFRDLPVRMLRTDEPAAADLIHVLGGTHRQPTARIDHAVSLFQLGLAPRLLLTGTDITMDWARHNRRRALELGVPEGALELDPRPRSTRAEAHLLRERVSREKLSSVILVTEAYHVGRATRIFERTLRGRGVRLLSCPVGLPAFPPPNWWGERESRALILGESVRLAALRMLDWA